MTKSSCTFPNSATMKFCLFFGLLAWLKVGVMAQISIPEQTSSLSASPLGENNRFFISSSQPALLLTEPPSLIVSLPTNTITTGSGSSSASSTETEIKPTSALKIRETAQKITELQSLNSVVSQQTFSEKESVNLLSQIIVEEEKETTTKTEIEDDSSTKMTTSSSSNNKKVSSSTLKSVNSDEFDVKTSKSETEVTETIDQTTNDSTLEAETTNQKSPKVQSSSGLPIVLGSKKQNNLGILASKTSISNEIQPTALPVMSSSSIAKESFLAPKVSKLSGVSRPQEDLPRVAPSVSSKLASQDSSRINNDSSKIKKNRQSDEQSTLPGMNDIITGLLNVVGEGLSLATNFVKEENERKKEKEAKEKEASLLKASISAVPALPLNPNFNYNSGGTGNNHRINNRGPPRFTEIPFEAIPLEILSSQRPGQNPVVQIQQRPFQYNTRIKINKTQQLVHHAPPFATGIPLPELLIPGLENFSSKETSSVSAGGSPVRFPNGASKIPSDKVTKLQNRYTTTSPINLEGNDIDFKQFQPTRPGYTDVTIKATATRPLIGPQRRPAPKRPPVVIENRPPSTIKTPPLRPFVRPPSPPPPPPIRPSPPPISTELPEPEVLFAGQAFDIDPSRPPPAGRPEIFDLTVSVKQNFGGNRAQSQNKDGIITKATQGGDQFVSIDGKRTYFAVAPTHMPTFQHTRPSVLDEPDYTNALNPIQSPNLVGSEDLIPLPSNSGHQGSSSTPGGNNFFEEPISQPIMNRPNFVIKPIPTLRPQAPPVRIDTCIVGDETTCEMDKHEVCLTYLGVSTCDCKPGYGRKDYRKACRKTIRLMMSMQVDQIKQNRIRWNNNYLNPNSEEYVTLEDEAVYAIDTVMAMTSMKKEFVSSEINKFFDLNGRVTVNATLLLLENTYTSSVNVKKDIQRKVIEVIQARGNNIGNGNLFVDGRLNPIPGVADVNECSDPLLNDCDPNYSRCINRFGSFDCKCLPGYGDRFAQDTERAGRFCESCSADYCSGRGSCYIEDGDLKVCECKGNFYGKRCELDGEVVAVAVGASVAAIVIILLTTFCLCIWSRKWKREQRKSEIMRSFPPSYISNAPGHPNPHLAATYMANLNKAAAYAAAAAASRHSVMTATANAATNYGPPQTAAGPNYGPPQTPMATSVTSQEDLRLQQEPYGGHNIYAQLYPLGNTSQFHSQELRFHPAPPPPNHPPPPVPLPVPTEPIYSYPSSLYGTLPRGPPRPIKRPILPIFVDEDQSAPLPVQPEAEVDDDGEDDLQKSLTGSFINYATFRQNISNDAAIAAQKRAMITAKIAKHWSNDDLPNLLTRSSKQTADRKSEDSDNAEEDEEDEEEEDSSEISDSNSNSDQNSNFRNSTRIASPSPPTRSRSSSPGKTVTFLEQDERSLNELESSPRRVIDLRSAASSLFGGGHKKLVKKGQKNSKNKKRLAPSPPLSKSLGDQDHDEIEEEAIAEDHIGNMNKNHKSLEARLSASLRATFARNSQN